MKQFDAKLVDALEKRVGELENNNTLEVVVRVVPESGHYRDVRWRWGAAAAMLTLLFATYAPMVIDPSLLPIELALIGLLAGYGGRRIPALARLMTSSLRRADQAQEGARACFVEQAVGGTRERTGVLVYVSLLEDTIVVLADHGAAGAAPLARWDGIRKLGRDRSIDVIQRLHTVLDDVHHLGDEFLPSAPNDNPDELPNRPLIGDLGRPS